MTIHQESEETWRFEGDPIPSYLSDLAHDREIRKKFELSTEKFYTTEEVADILKIEKEVIRDYIRKGELFAIKIGKAYRITDSDLQEFLHRRYTRYKAGDANKKDKIQPE